jgi:transcriptional regulator with GAF, ATPase, and Fis domain
MRSFAAHPLVFNSLILGVLGVFSRQVIPGDQLAALRLFADHAALSLSNARAFEELQGLQQKLEFENSYLQEEVREAKLHHEIVGRGAAVLASVPRELFESEFFGHVKGAFTGALKDRADRFQLADRDALFLDEVGEIPLELQSKLLRVPQEGEFERFGDGNTRKVDARLIAATNRDFCREAEKKQFREDLYYRLSIFPNTVPPLRERREDLPMLAAHFVSHSARRMGMPEPRLTGPHIRALEAYDWPGNGPTADVTWGGADPTLPVEAEGRN